MSCRPMCRDEDNPLAVTEAENWQNCGLFTHLQTAAKAGTEFKQETKEEQKDWPSTEQPNQEAAASAPWRRPTGVKNIDSSHEDQEMEAGAEEEKQQRMSSNKQGGLYEKRMPEDEDDSMDTTKARDGQPLDESWPEGAEDGESTECILPDNTEVGLGEVKDEEGEEGQQLVQMVWLPVADMEEEEDKEQLTVSTLTRQPEITFTGRAEPRTFRSLSLIFS